MPCRWAWLSAMASTSRPRSSSSSAGIGLPVRRLMAIRNASVPATPTGALSTTTSWPFSARYLLVFSQQYSWNTMVALACRPATTSSLVVPPSYMRNSPSVGVLHEPEGSHSTFTWTPNRLKMRRISFMLPTTKPSKPAMKLMLSSGTRVSLSVVPALPSQKCCSTPSSALS